MSGASVALAARVVLAAVLASSSAAKLRARTDVRAQMGRLIGERLAPVVVPSLPAVEALVAVALIAWWSPVPGVVALALLAGFTVVVVRAQAQRVPCACFGAVRADSPAGPAAVVRNGVLAGLAVLAIGAPRGARAVGTIVAVLVLGAFALAAVRAAR